MFPLRENSAEAAFLLMMLALDIDGIRKDVEFDTVANCLKGLSDELEGDGDYSQEALFPILHAYYDDVAAIDDDEGMLRYMDEAMARITDQKLRKDLFASLVEIAMADNELHQKENAFLRRTGLTWNIDYSG